LRDAIKQIEGIKLIQQEQQKKYFLTIPSLLNVPPNLHYTLIRQIGLFLVCISAAIILSFPSVNFLMYLSLSLGHKMATPPLPLGTWKFEIGSLQSEHRI
jgi:hypothetical protein